MLNLELPDYSGPALRISYREGELGYLSGEAIHREDWWFTKQHGLVLIEQKYFGDWSENFKKAGITWSNGKFTKCTDDPDCLKNTRIANPQTVATLRSLNN